MTTIAELRLRYAAGWEPLVLEMGVPERALSGKNVPCPGCGGRDRFRWDSAKQLWCCSQGSGDLIGGDAIDLLAHIQGTSCGTILQQIQLLRPVKTPVSRSSERVRRQTDYVAKLPVPKECRGNYRSLLHPTLGTPARYWEYLSATGDLHYAVARFETSEGKAVRPLSFDGARWRWKRPHVLIPWNLPDVYAEPKLPVLVCEGEKAAQAAKPLAQGFVVTCGHGGASQAHLTEWGHLARRNVLIFPDDDAASTDTWSVQLQNRLHTLGCQVAVVDPAEFWRSAA